MLNGTHAGNQMSEFRSANYFCQKRFSSDFGSISTFLQSKKKKGRLCPCNHQPGAKCLHCEQTVSWEQRFHTLFFLLHYIDMLQLLQRWMYVKQVSNLSVATITLYLLFSPSHCFNSSCLMLQNQSGFWLKPKSKGLYFSLDKGQTGTLHINNIFLAVSHPHCKLLGCLHLPVQQCVILS